MDPSCADKVTRFAGRVREEMPFIVGLATLCAFEFGADGWLKHLDSQLIAALLFGWLFVAML